MSSVRKWNILIAFLMANKCKSLKLFWVLTLSENLLPICVFFCSTSLLLAHCAVIKKQRQFSHYLLQLKWQAKMCTYAISADFTTISWHAYILSLYDFADKFRNGKENPLRLLLLLSANDIRSKYPPKPYPAYSYHSFVSRFFAGIIRLVRKIPNFCLNCFEQHTEHMFIEHSGIWAANRNHK